MPPPSPVALRLGWLALVPFVAGAGLVWLVRADAGSAARAGAVLSAYAAVVVAFIGGIHWGFGFRDVGFRHNAPSPSPSLFAWGVVPALVACAAVLLPPSAGLVIHGAMIGVCYLVDRKVYPAQGAAAWLGLRLRLSAVAGLCCLIGAAGS